MESVYPYSSSLLKFLLYEHMSLSLELAEIGDIIAAVLYNKKIYNLKEMTKSCRILLLKTWQYLSLEWHGNPLKGLMSLLSWHSRQINIGVLRYRQINIGVLRYRQINIGVLRYRQINIGVLRFT